MKKTLVSILAYIFLAVLAYPQDEIFESVILNSKNEVRIVKFYDNKFLVPISKAESVIRKVYKLNEFDELRKIRTSEDKFGIIHTRYQ